MAKEMKRTCKRDGTVWYVSIRASKERRPPRGLKTGLALQGYGSMMSFGSGSKAGGATQLGWIDAKTDRVERNKSCPTCGSQSFTQKKVKV